MSCVGLGVSYLRISSPLALMLAVRASMASCVAGDELICKPIRALRALPDSLLLEALSRSRLLLAPNVLL